VSPAASASDDYVARARQMEEEHGERLPRADGLSKRFSGYSGNLIPCCQLSRIAVIDPRYAVVDEAVSDPDPWRGFRFVIERPAGPRTRASCAPTSRWTT
jgi:hypothetical protein